MGLYIKIYLFILFVAFPVCVIAGDNSKKNSDVSYFQCGEVVYFDRCREAKKPNNPDKRSQEQVPTSPAQAPDSNTNQQQEDERKKREEIALMWGEPTLNENGKIVYRLPPKPVLDLLMSMSKDDAKKYLEWNSERLRRITEAGDLVQKIAEEGKTQLNQTERIKP